MKPPKYTLNDYGKNSHISHWISGLQWTKYVTLTTNYDLTENSAHRLAKRYFQKVISAVEYENPLKKNETHSKMFYTIEDFKIKGGTHIHALMDIPNGNKVNNAFLIDIYQKTAGSHTWHRNKIVDINQDLNAVSNYLCKYVTKQNNLRFDLLTNKNFHYLD